MFLKSSFNSNMIASLSITSSSEVELVLKDIKEAPYSLLPPICGYWDLTRHQLRVSAFSKLSSPSPISRLSIPDH